MKIKPLVSLLMCAAVLLGAAGVSCAEPDQELMPHSYEVHFLLDSGLVLDESHQLKQELREKYHTDDKIKSYSVVYFETPERSFIREGWVNRLRRKEGGKKGFELTYKKRYPVSGEDIRSAMQLAESEGFDLSSGIWEAEIEWGHSGMTLSVSAERNFTSGGYVRLEDLDPADATAAAVRYMPAEEQNWKEIYWGSSHMEAARMTGPVTFKRYTGAAFGQEVRFEVWKLHSREGKADRYITELSFKADNYEDAAAGREEITAGLTEAGLLIPNDALKTQEILNAYFREYAQ